MHSLLFFRAWFITLQTPFNSLHRWTWRKEIDWLDTKGGTLIRLWWKKSGRVGLFLEIGLPLIVITHIQYRVGFYAEFVFFLHTHQRAMLTLEDIILVWNHRVLCHFLVESMLGQLQLGTFENMMQYIGLCDCRILEFEPNSFVTVYFWTKSYLTLSHFFEPWG